jgi:hypothetical protein
MMQRDIHLSQMISARNDQYLRDQEIKAQLEQQKKAALSSERQRSLERQIEEKKQMMAAL